jgi:hypothetical protein
MDDDSFEFNFWPAFSDFMVSLVLILCVIIGLLSVRLPPKPPPETAGRKLGEKTTAGPVLPPGKTREEFLFEELSNRLLDAQKLMPARLKPLGQASANSMVFDLIRFHSASELQLVPSSPTEDVRTSLTVIFSELYDGKVLDRWARELDIELTRVQVRATGNLIDEAAYLDRHSTMLIKYISDHSSEFGVPQSILGRVNDYAAGSRRRQPVVGLRLNFQLGAESRATAIKEYEERRQVK